MKQDMELIKLILQTLADNENYFMLSDHLAKQIQAITNEKDAFNNKFIGHFFLAKDANLISEMSVCFFTGQGYNRAMPANGGKVRITAQGLEFLDALKEDTIFNKIKDYSIGIAAETGKSLLISLASKTLGLSEVCIFRGGQCRGDEKRSMTLKNEMPLFSGQETNGK